MKLFVILIFCTTFFLHAEPGYSQEERIHLTVNNVKISDVLKEIERQTNYLFFYNHTEIGSERAVSLDAADVSLNSLLSQMFKNTDVNYTIVDKHIVLTKNKELANLAAAVQGAVITGTVTDETGDPMPGVNVVIKGTNTGVVTGSDGKYSISVPDNTSMLVFSFMGYTSHEIVVGNQMNINIILNEDARQLEEVVVIGYGTARRSDLTGSVGSVQITEMVKAPVPSFDDALAGRVVGVSVTSSDGQPGSMPEIIIRGGNSLTQSNSPLYVVDGFPLEDNDNSSINPNDIESIDILKDASATAIYGARGANGVVMITTKSGKEGKPTINFSGYYGIQKDINKLKLLSPYDFVSLQLELNPENAPNTYLTKPGRTLEDYKNIEGIDWYEKVLQTASMQNYSLSVSGGTAKTKYYISGSYLGQDGLFTNSGYKRYQGRISLDQEINNKLKIRLNVNYSNTKNWGTIATSNGGSVSASLMYSIWGYRPVMTDSTVDLEDELSDPEVNPTVDYRVNPILQAKNELREKISQNLLANANIEWSIIKGLKLNVTGSVSGFFGQNNEFNNSKTRTGSEGYPQSLGPNGTQTFPQSVTFSNENILTYSIKLNRVHSFTVVGGFSQQVNRSSLFGAQAVQITNESLGVSGMDEGSPRSITATSSNWALQSFFGRINYDYKSKYLLTATIRADGSSRFSKGNKWGYFPSAALAYRLSNEDFMKSIQVISNAKIRVGYGVTGNNRVSDFAYISGIGTSNSAGYSFGNGLPSRGTYVSGLPNSDLKWESTGQFNAGLDVAILKHRISFTGDYYYKKTKDLLLQAQMPYASGFNTAYKNIGSVSNRGIELSLSTVNILRSKFSWYSDFNISFNRSKVLELTDNQTALTSTVSAIWGTNPCYIAKVGDPVAMFYGTIFDGLFQYEDFNQLTNGSYSLKPDLAANGQTRANIRPGDANYRDLNGDKTIDLNDYTVIGNPNPDFIGGLNNTFEYMGFDLSIFLQFSYGNEVMNANRVVFENTVSGSNNRNQYASYANRWTEENPTGNIPRAGISGGNFFSSRIIEDASFLRLKTISLGYNLPQRVLDKLRIKSLRIYLSAQNLYTWTNYSGVDPEVSTRHSALTPGYDYSPYPRQKTLTGGINLSF